MKKALETEILERLELLEIENEMLLSRLGKVNMELGKKRTMWHARPSDWDFITDIHYHSIPNPRMQELSEKYRKFEHNFKHKFQ
jgi:hypothetical protein